MPVRANAFSFLTNDSGKGENIDGQNGKDGEKKNRIFGARFHPENPGAQQRMRSDEVEIAGTVDRGGNGD